MMNTTLQNRRRNKFDKAMATFMHNHPFFAFLITFVGIPVFILTAVFFCSSAIMLPISWTMGWI